MRRLLSILFTLVLAFISGLSPALASVPAHPIASGWTGKVDESHIPACCRKNGKHHCTMPDGAASSDAPVTSVSATGCCPCSPLALASATTPAPALTSSATASLALSEERRTIQARIEIARASDRRVQPKRGPPSQAI